MEISVPLKDEPGRSVWTAIPTLYVLKRKGDQENEIPM
jgi:hypothetical protein